MYVVTTYENLLPSPQADAEQFVNNAAALARTGHEVELVIPRPPGPARDVRSELFAYYQIDGPLRITEVPTYHPNIVVQHLRHAQLVASDPRFSRADFVYTRNLGMLTANLRAGRRALFEHYRPWGDQFPPMQVWLRRVMTDPGFLGMVLHSRFAARSYLRLGVPRDQLEVCHNGWEPKRMSPRLSRDEARVRLGLPRDRSIVVYAGRMNHKKGLETLLGMAKERPEATFVLVGSTGDGPIERAAGAIGNVRIEPWKRFADVAPYLYAADVLVVPPSDAPLRVHGNTVLPLKLFVYLAAGRTILAPDTPDVRELLEHGESAWLVPPAEPRRAASALAALLEDDELRNRLSSAAAARAAELTWDARAARVLAFAEARLGAERSEPGPFSLVRCLRETAHWLAGGIAHGRWVHVPRLPA